MKKWSLFFYAFLFFSASLFAVEGIELSRVRFYNDGSSSALRDQRVYNTQFAKSEARFIWCELEVKNLYYNFNDQRHWVMWRYYNSDNSLRGELSSEFAIQKDWSYSYISHGWGWDQGGNWPVGIYRVELWVDQTRFAEGYFSIVDSFVPSVPQPQYSPTPNVSATEPLQFQTLQMFEGGQDSKPTTTTTYLDRFPKSTTRYISFVVRSKNLLYGIRDYTSDVTGYFYRADGSFVGQAKINVNISSSWRDTDLWSGWGWNTPGNWQVGNYRLVLHFGTKQVAEKTFSVYDDKTPYTPPIYTPQATPTPFDTPQPDLTQSGQLEFQFVKLFEGGSDTKPDNTTNYINTFPKSSTRYISFVVGARNLLYQIRDHTSDVTGYFYRADGSFVGKAAINVNISSSWKETDLWSGWGWNVPGNWVVGSYRLVIYFGSKQVGETPFTVYDDRTSFNTTPPVAPTIPPIAPASETNLQFQFLKLYESGQNARPDNSTEYKNSFAKSSTRYVSFLVGAKNLLYNIRDHVPMITGTFYRQDGSQVGKATINLNISSSWDETDLWSGWGWTTPGNWQVGNYRLVLHFGSQQVAEAKFTVYDDTMGYVPPTTPTIPKVVVPQLPQVPSVETPQIQFQFVKLYESDKSAKPTSTTQYKNNFDRSSTRYISFVVGVKNLLYNVRDQKPLIVGYYYKADGTLLGKAPINVNVPKTWNEVDLWSGWGGTTPGTWQVGTYRLVIYFGSKQVTETTFTVSEGSTTDASYPW